jgi:hypothetical protein
MPTNPASRKKACAAADALRHLEVYSASLLEAKLQELPAMSKKHTKNEKLDLILSELSELKGVIKKLLKDHAADTDRGVKTRPKSTPAQRSKVKKRTVARKKPAETVVPSKPVLVPNTPDAATG